MKILFAGASGDRYGADAVLSSIAAHMCSRGAKCVLVLPEDGPGREAAARAGLRVEVMHMPVLRRADLNIGGLMRMGASAFPDLLAHMRMLRAERPDLVWVNTVTIPLWILAARLLGIPVVCHSHETVGDDSPWTRRCLFLPLFFADRVVAVSEACRSDIVTTYPYLGPRVVAALNPSFAVRKPIPVRAGSENEIVVIGRISARKGHGVLLKALDEPALTGLRPVVHVCGAPYRSAPAEAFASRLRSRAASSKSAIHFHGYVPTEEALSMGSMVVVASTEPESCPLVIAEAMAAGRAVVASECGGIAELVGGAALLVPGGRPDALAAALASLIADPVRRGQLETASLARAKTLSPETYLAGIERLVRDTAAPGSPSVDPSSSPEVVR